MRLLRDANLSPKIADRLAAGGHDATHVTDLGLLTAPDSVIFDQAAADGYVIVTADSDFPMLLALRRASAPSVVLLRGVAELTPAGHAALLLANLPNVAGRSRQWCDRLHQPQSCACPAPSDRVAPGALVRPSPR